MKLLKMLICSQLLIASISTGSAELLLDENFQADGADKIAGSGVVGLRCGNSEKTWLAGPAAETIVISQTPDGTYFLSQNDPTAANASVAVDLPEHALGTGECLRIKFGVKPGRSQWVGVGFMSNNHAPGRDMTVFNDGELVLLARRNGEWALMNFSQPGGALELASGSGQRPQVFTNYEMIWCPENNQVHLSINGEAAVSSLSLEQDDRSIVPNIKRLGIQFLRNEQAGSGGVSYIKVDKISSDEVASLYATSGFFAAMPEMRAYDKLLNGGFHVGLGLWSTADMYGAGLQAERLAKDDSGKFALRLTRPDARSQARLQTHALRWPKEPVTVKFFLRGKKEGDITLDLAENHWQGPVYDSKTLPLTDDWVEHTVLLKTGKKISAPLHLKWRLGKDVTSFDIADVRLEDVNGNLLNDLSPTVDLAWRDDNPIPHVGSPAYLQVRVGPWTSEQPPTITGGGYDENKNPVELPIADWKLFDGYAEATLQFSSDKIGWQDFFLS